MKKIKQVPTGDKKTSQKLENSLRANLQITKNLERDLTNLNLELALGPLGAPFPSLVVRIRRNPATSPRHHPAKLTIDTTKISDNSERSPAGALELEPRPPIQLREDPTFTPRRPGNCPDQAHRRQRLRFDEGGRTTGRTLVFGGSTYALSRSIAGEMERVQIAPRRFGWFKSLLTDFN